MKKNGMNSRWMYIGFVLLALFFCRSLPAAFPVDDLIQEEFDYRSGFPLVFVSGIGQTADGYLWLAGKNRLLRYDGIQFEFIDNSHNRFLVDRNGVLWYCSYRELVSVRNGEITRHPFPAGMTLSTDIKLADDRKGNVWIAVDRGPLIHYDGERFVTHYEISSPTDLVEDSQGNLWIGTFQHGLYQYRNQEFKPFSAWEGGEPPNVFCLFVDRGNDLWIGSNGQGLYRMHWVEGDSRPRMSRFVEGDGLPFNIVTCFESDGEGGLWIGTSSGFCRLTRTAEGKVEFSRSLLSGQSILKLFFDHEGSLWVGTLTRGMVRFRRNYFRYKEDSRTFSPALLADAGGDMWIGTVLGNIIRCRDGRNEVFLTENHSESLSVLSIARIRERILFGTLRQGLFELVDGRMRRPAGFPASWNLGVLFIAEDRRGRLLVSSTDGLFVRTGEVVTRCSRADILLSNWIYRTFEDCAGDIWVLGARGVCRFSGGELRLESRKVPLPDRQMLDMRQDSQDPQRFWFCGPSGLFTIKGNDLFSFNRGNGLVGDSLHQLFADEQGYFWLSGMDGILRVSRKELLEYASGVRPAYSCLQFDRVDGLAPISSYRPQSSIVRTPRGELWFSTSEGIAVIDPNKISFRHTTSKIVLKELEIDGEKSTDFKQRRFRGARNISFSLALLSFIDQDRTRLEYKLEGRDPKWLSLEPRQRNLTFTRLPSGSYSLEVRVRNREGFIDSGGFRFDFTFGARFYETPLFYGLMVMVVIGGLVFAKWLRRRLMRLKVLEAREREQPAFSERENLFHHKLLLKLESEKVYRDEDITLNTLARQLGAQPWELSRVINEVMNQNFWTLINGYRIREAQELLSAMDRNDRSVLDICYDVGFNSKSSFYRAFKKFTGMTPNEYLQRVGPAKTRP